MTDEQSPLTTAFELQRTTIEQSREAFEQMVEFQRRFNEAVVSGTAATGELQSQGIETSQRVLHTYLDAVEATLPGADDAVDRIRDTIDEQFDQLEAQQEETLSAVEDSIDDVADVPTEYLDSMDDQLDLVVDAHEQVEERTVEALDQMESQVEQIQEEARDQTAQQAETLQKRISELQDQVQVSGAEE
jgi:gas vesicle protein